MIPVHFITKPMPVVGDDTNRFFYLFYLMIGKENSLVVAVEPEFHGSLTNAEEELVKAGEAISALLDGVSEQLFTVSEEMLKEPVLYVALSEKDDQVAFKIKHPVLRGFEDQFSDIFGNVINAAYLT